MSDDLEKKMIEQAIVALWPKVQEGDPKAIDRMLRLFDRKATAAKPKRRYKMSPKALRQRRAAALKTGEHAGTTTAPMVSKAREVETTKQSGLAVAVDAEFVAIFEQAMNDDPAALRQLTAGQLAALALQDAQCFGELLGLAGLTGGEVGRFETLGVPFALGAGFLVGGVGRGIARGVVGGDELGAQFFDQRVDDLRFFQHGDRLKLRCNLAKPKPLG